MRFLEKLSLEGLKERQFALGDRDGYVGLEVLPVGHAILVPEVRTTVIREVLDWLDRYLGKP